MGSMRKDIYKTLKRSISGAKNDIQSSSTNANVKYGSGSGSTWIHPPDVLINGRVEYTVRFLGTTEVQKPRGADVVRDAIVAINFQRDIKRSEVSHSSAKLQKVDIQISIDTVSVVDNKTKTVLHTYPLSKISFCADDKQDKRVFSFIARADKTSRHDCYVFVSEKLAEQITLTIGEAFDLGYKRFLDKNRASLETQKQMFIYRKRIVELEAENQVLSQRLAEAIRGQRGHQASHSLMDEISSGMTPSLPTSPMPVAPPPNLPSNIYSTPRNDPDLTVPTTLAPVLHDSTPSTPSQNSPSGPAPALPPPRAPALAPPPPVAPRRLVPKPTASLDEVVQTEKEANVFDDDFDPRAEEKKNDQEPTCSKTPVETDPTTAADFQAMIDKVDLKLAAMNSGDYPFAKLETGKLSPGEIDGIEESEYGTPSDKLNPQVMNLKQ